MHIKCTVIHFADDVCK